MDTLERYDDMPRPEAIHEGFHGKVKDLGRPVERFPKPDRSDDRSDPDYSDNSAAVVRDINVITDRGGRRAVKILEGQHVSLESLPLLPRDRTSEK